MFLPNFNFKKLIKYCFIVLCIFLVCNSCDVKAWSNLSTDYTVNYSTEDDSNLADFIITGSFTDLIVSGNVDSTAFNTYYTSMKNTIINKLGYSSWESFTNDYYYINDLWINGNSFEFSFFYCIKTATNADKFALSMATSIRSSSTPTINANQAYYTQFGAIYRTNSFYFVANGNSLSSGVGVENGPAYNNHWSYNSFAGRVLYCTSSTDTCTVNSYDNTTKTLSIIFNNDDDYFASHYVDTNKPSLDLYFAKVNSLLESTDYVFQKATVGNSNTVYNLVEPIASNVLGLRYISPNVQDLNNNSFGIKSNSIITTFKDTNYTKNIICPNDREFNNNTCYIYLTDVENYDINNTHYSNSIRYYFGDDTNIPLRANYYYVLTIRVYTPYNLSINQVRASSGTLNSPTTIDRVVVKDFFTYKDYQIVFSPNVTGNFTVNFLDVYFNNYSTLTNVLDDTLSFGAFDFVKYSEFATLPSDTVLLENYNTNNLDAISTNSTSSFFSDFHINDRGLSQIILLPLNFVRSWTNATCSPISLPLPHLSNAQYPCLSPIFSDYFGSFWTLYKLIINGIIIYRICIHLLRIVKNIYSVENNEIEVIDL